MNLWINIWLLFPYELYYSMWSLPRKMTGLWFGFDYLCKLIHDYPSMWSCFYTKVIKTFLLCNNSMNTIPLLILIQKQVHWLCSRIWTLPTCTKQHYNWHNQRKEHLIKIVSPNFQRIKKGKLEKKMDDKKNWSKTQPYLCYIIFSHNSKWYNCGPKPCCHSHKFWLIRPK